MCVVMSLINVLDSVYRPALVMIISVPISWNRFHRSDPCRSTRVSSPVPDTGVVHRAAGCGLSSSASSLSAGGARLSFKTPTCYASRAQAVL